MFRYVDLYRDQFGVELICRVLANMAGGFMVSGGYLEAKNRPVSNRATHGQILDDEMERLHAEDYGVYGLRKMYHLMRRQGWIAEQRPRRESHENPRDHWRSRCKNNVHDPVRNNRHLVDRQSEQAIPCGLHEPTVGPGHYICRDMARNCVFGVCHRSVLTQYRRPVGVINTNDLHVDPTDGEYIYVDGVRRPHGVGAPLRPRLQKGVFGI